MFQRWLVWPLFAAIMGFALGGSAFWGLYGSNATIHQISQATEQQSDAQEAKSKKEETDEALATYTLWLMVFTGILAFATIGLGGATVGLYLTGEKQVRLGRSIARRQFLQTQSSIQLAVNDFNATHRPWISVRVEAGEMGLFSNPLHGLGIQLEFVCKNHGETPAIFVGVFCRPYFHRNEARIAAIQQEMRQRALAIPESAERGVTIFPGEEARISLLHFFQTDGAHLIGKIQTMCIVAGSIGYSFPFGGNERHQTAFAYTTHRGGPVWEGRDIPPQDLIFRKAMFNENFVAD